MLLSLMDRRKFFTVAGSTCLAALTVGCQSAPADSLKIALLEESVPPQLIQIFKQQLLEGEGVSVIPANSLLQLYEMLQEWQRSSKDNGAATASMQSVANWLTMGDYWLQSTIRQKLIQPVDVTQLDHWQELPEPWVDLLRRNNAGEISETGDIWGIPYRWSNLAILYDPSKAAKATPVTQWEDLLHPAWSQRLVLPDHPRLVIGLGLKAVGASANVEDPTQVPGLVEFLRALHQQVRFYSSDYYLESLIIGDVSGVVGWAEAMQPILKQYRQFAGVIPNPGTLMTADLWVQPASVTSISFANRWPDFCLSEDFATLLANYGPGVSPRWLGQNPVDLPAALQQSPLLSTSPQIQADSEFLQPLSETVQARYLDLWQSLRGQDQSES